jgi:hypothetical protein
VSSQTFPTVDGYRLEAEIGRGGFAVVYRAVQLSLGRNTAIKVLSIVDVEDDELRRFRQECEALAQLGWNRHVVQIFDAGTTADGRPFLAMELLEGGSVATKAKSQALSPAQITDCGVQIAGALSAAHGIDVLHRDVKPDNILTDRSGGFRLGDFGIASIGGRSRTATGAMAGTIAYMAPEVVLGERATAQSDIYGLGATLYSLVAGTAPFSKPTDETPVAAIQRILHEEPPSLRGLGIPIGLASAIETAMHRDPNRRFPSASHLQSALAGGSVASDRIVVMEPPASPTVLRAIVPDRPVAQQTVLQPIAHTAVAPVVAAPADGRRAGLPTAVIISLAALGALVIGGAFALAFVALRSSPKVSTSAASAPPATAVPATPAPTVVAPAPATTTTSTTVVLVTTTIPPTTTARVAPTKPPTTVPFDTGRQAVTPNQASALLDRYFRTAGLRRYSEAWAMCTERYQTKYVSYEKFVSFWDRVATVGIDSTTPDGETTSGGAVLLADVWFNGTNGHLSKEAIRIEVVGEGDFFQIDDYIPLRQR